MFTAGVCHRPSTGISTSCHSNGGGSSSSSRSSSSCIATGTVTTCDQFNNLSHHQHIVKGRVYSGPSRAPQHARLAPAGATRLQSPVLKDPPSAYHALRQQLSAAHSQQCLFREQQQQQHEQGDQATPMRQQRWPRAADEVCRAISRRLKQAGTSAAVLQVVRDHGVQFNTVNTALAFAQLARHLRFDSHSGRAAVRTHASFRALTAAALQQAGQFNPRQLAMVLTSLAWMDSPDEQHQASTATGAGPETQQQQQQEEALLLQALCQRLQAVLDACEPDDTCHCLWALTKLQALPTQLLSAATTHSLERGWLSLLTAKPLSSLLWVHAQAHLSVQQHRQGSTTGLQELPKGSAEHDSSTASDEDAAQQQLLPQFVRAVMRELATPGFLATWTPQELSMLLWSCAVLGIPLERQHPPLHGQQHQQQQQHTEDHTASQVQQGGSLFAAHLPAAVLQEVCVLARQHVVQFTPQGVAMVCWSLAELLTAAGPDAAAHSTQAAAPPQRPWQRSQQHAACPAVSQLPHNVQQAVLQLFDVFTHAAAARQQYYRPQEVANIYSACTRLQLVPVVLTQAVTAYTSSHSHLLGPRDVTDLLLCAVQRCKPQHAGQLGLDDVAVRALLHRVQQLTPSLTGFQLAAGAWACVRLGEQQRARSSTQHSTRSSRSSCSSLHQECVATASVLLDALSHRHADDVAAAAAAAAGVSSDAPSAFTMAPAASGLWSGTLHSQHTIDVKQAVALAWALAGTVSTTVNSASAGLAAPPAGAAAAAAAVSSTAERSSLAVTALTSLQQCAGTCGAAALVQILCVLPRLVQAYGLGSGSQGPDRQQLQVPMQVLQLLQDVQQAVLVRLPPLLHELSADDAASAAWAVARLQVCLPKHPAGPSTSWHRQSQHSAAASVVSAVLQQLHDRQQLQRMTAQQVSALLWSCQECRWAPPAPVYLELLKAADARLLQMQPGQQVAVLQALAAMAAVTGPGAFVQLQQAANAGAVQQLRQVHQQEARLLHDVAEQLQHHMYRQLSQLVWQRKVGPHLQHAEQLSYLQPQQLVTIVAACARLPQMQRTQLLQQLLEVWQALLQQGLVPVHQALLMTLHLADALPDSPAQPWHEGILDSQQQQRQQDYPPGLLQHMLQETLSSLPAALSQHGMQGSTAQALRGETLVLALRVCVKLRFQPHPAVVMPLVQQLQALLPGLSETQVAAALAACVQLGLVVPGLTAAALSELGRRHQLQVVTAPAAYSQGMQQQQPQHTGQQEEQPLQPPSFVQGVRPRSALVALWAALSCGLLAHSSGFTADKHVLHLLARLATAAASLAPQQLLQRPQLLDFSAQMQQMLRYCEQYRCMWQALRHQAGRLSHPQALLQQQLRSMTQLLLPQGLAVRTRQQVLLQLLQAGPEHRQVLLQQRLLAEQPRMQLQGVQQHMLVLLPLWLQQQLQKHCQQQLARAVVVAQLAAGKAAFVRRAGRMVGRRAGSKARRRARRKALLSWVQGRPQLAAGHAAAVMRLQYMPSGDVVLLLCPQSRQVQPQLLQDQGGFTQTRRAGASGADSSMVAADHASSSSSSSVGKGVAVVLEPASHRSINTGSLLGHSLVMRAVLEAQGYSVVTLPLQQWLPDYIIQHAHGMQLVQQQAKPRRHQDLRHRMSRDMRQLGRARRHQAAQLLKVLRACA